MGFVDKRESRVGPNGKDRDFPETLSEI